MKSHFDMKHTTYVQELNYCKNTTLLFIYFFQNINTTSNLLTL